MSEEYDAFEHLCEILYPDNEDGLMFFWKSRFDASGSDSPILVVAGFVANIPQWKEFNKKWKVPLTKDGKTVIFHATDFESGRGDFADEKEWNETRKVAVRAQLVEAVISSNLELAITSGVIINDYKRHMGGWRAEIFGEAYEFCARNALGSVALYFHENNIQDPVSHIFEQGDEGQGELFDAFRKASTHSSENRDFYKLHSLVFQPKQHAIGLQAADMLAHYSWHRESGRTFGPSIERLFTDTSMIRTFYDDRQFTKLHARDDAGFKMKLRSAEFSFKTPPKIDVAVAADFTEADAVLDELEGLMETSPERVYSLIKDSASVAKLFRLEAENEVARGTTNLRVLLKPNDLAFERIAAIRASHREPDLSE